MILPFISSLGKETTETVAPPPTAVKQKEDEDNNAPAVVAPPPQYKVSGLPSTAVQPEKRKIVLEDDADENAPAPVAPVAAAPVVAAAPKASPANGEKVLSPFPGLIKNLLVADGATVKKDQPILVLEAMKMDNDIVAPCDGVVHFQVVKGANVESDAVLAVIA